MRREKISEDIGSSENVKSGILQESIQLKRKKERNTRIKNLERELANLNIKLTESAKVSDSLVLNYQEIQNKQEKEYDYVTDGII